MKRSPTLGILRIPLHIPHRELGWLRALPHKRRRIPGSSLPGGYWGVFLPGRFSGAPKELWGCVSGPITLGLSKKKNKKKKENSITSCNEIWDRNIIIIDDIFAFSVAHKIMDDDCEPQSIIECRQRQDWSKWEEAIKVELASLAKREVFGPITRIPDNVKPVGYKWVFVRKRNEKNEVIRYEARLVTQGFSHRPGIDYDETYSPVMDMITFRFLISLVLFEKLEMHLMDIVTAYLYGSLDSDIYMKIPKGFKMPDACTSRNLFSIKLQRSLYRLKQSGHMWYQRLSEYLIKERYKNDPIFPCMFIKKSETGFAIVVVYVDDINLIGTLEE